MVSINEIGYSFKKELDNFDIYIVVSLMFNTETDTVLYIIPVN